MNTQPIYFLLALALAFITESMTEYIFAVWFDLAAKRWPVLVEIAPLRYVAMLVGVGLAFAYQLDLLYAAFGVVAGAPYVGILITGLAIGRGANWLHDFASRYLGLNVSA